MRYLKWIAAVIGLLAILALGAIGVGAMLPEDHVARVSAGYEASPKRIWTAITEVEAFPDWRSGVDRVEERDAPDGRTWVEHGATGAMTLQVVEAEPPRRLVLRIADPELPFGGTWTYEVEPIHDGARLTITENGEIYNPFFRVMARFVFGYDATARAYLVDLGRKLGEDVEPRTITAD